MWRSHTALPLLLLLLLPLLTASWTAALLFKPQEPLRVAQSLERGNPLTDEFGEYVHSLLDKFRVPSITIAVVDGDHTYTAGYGTAVFPDIKAKPETLYYVGSTTKSFTAAALTLLQDWSWDDAEGLRLTDPLAKHLDHFQLACDQASLHVSIEDALSHRSGMPRHDHCYGGSGYTSDDLLKALPYLPFSKEPRTTFQYNNIMYMLASRVVENSSNTSFDTFVRKHLWEPWGMDSTFMSLQDAQAAEKERGLQLARGYFWDHDTKQWVAEQWMDDPVVTGAGHAISNVVDYAKYLSAMISGHGPISSRGHEELGQPRITTERLPSPYSGPGTYALGWMTAVYHGEEIFHHAGSLFGFGAYMVTMPSKKWGVAMFANTERRSNAIQEILYHRLMDDLLDVPQSQRLDLESAAVTELRKIRIDFLNSTKRLYPEVPSQPLPHALPIDAYTGEYWHPAYRNMTLGTGQAHYPGGSGEVVLRAAMTDRTWQFEVLLEHVSGEHFTAWCIPLEDRPNTLFQAAHKAEFRLGPDGRVEAVGIGWEEAMGEDKIWYEKKEEKSHESASRSSSNAGDPPDWLSREL